MFLSKGLIHLIFLSTVMALTSPSDGSAMESRITKRDTWTCNVPNGNTIAFPCQFHGFPCKFFNVTSTWCDGKSYKVDNYDVDTYRSYSTRCVSGFAGTKCYNERVWKGSDNMTYAVAQHGCPGTSFQVPFC